MGNLEGNELLCVAGINYSTHKVPHSFSWELYKMYIVISTCYMKKTKLGLFKWHPKKLMAGWLWPGHSIAKTPTTDRLIDSFLFSNHPSFPSFSSWYLSKIQNQVKKINNITTKIMREIQIQTTLQLTWKIGPISFYSDPFFYKDHPVLPIFSPGFFYFMGAKKFFSLKTKVSFKRKINYYLRHSLKYHFKPYPISLHPRHSI